MSGTSSHLALVNIFDRLPGDRRNHDIMVLARYTFRQCVLVLLFRFPVFILVALFWHTTTRL